MGLFDFLGDVGRNLFGGGDEADKLKREIEKELGGNVENLQVQFNNGVVTLSGTAKSDAAQEKAVLIAGNVKGVRQVNDDRFVVAGQRPAAAQPAAGAKAAAPAAPKPAPRFYTIESGDNLSKIAKQFYGDANQWQKLFEANREVIQDPDKIYPGQQIRVPEQLG